MTSSLPALLLPVAFLPLALAPVRPSPGGPSGTPPAAAVARPAPPAAAAGAPARRPAPRSGFVWPLAPAPRVVRPFAVGPQPWSPGHRGVDLAAPASAVVRSAGPGRVRFTGTVAGRPVVVVEHAGGLTTEYEPVHAAVARGDAVAAGDVLGHLVTAGSHCAPQACLHWGARRDGRYVDPLTLLGLFRPVVLLPWSA